MKSTVGTRTSDSAVADRQRPSKISARTAMPRPKDEGIFQRGICPLSIAIVPSPESSLKSSIPTSSHPAPGSLQCYRRQPEEFGTQIFPIQFHPQETQPLPLEPPLRPSGCSAIPHVFTHPLLTLHPFHRSASAPPDPYILFCSFPPNPLSLPTLLISLSGAT